LLQQQSFCDEPQGGENLQSQQKFPSKFPNPILQLLLLNSVLVILLRSTATTFLGRILEDGIQESEVMIHEAFPALASESHPAYDVVVDETVRIEKSRLSTYPWAHALVAVQADNDALLAFPRLFEQVAIVDVKGETRPPLQKTEGVALYLLHIGEKLTFSYKPEKGTIAFTWNGWKLVPAFTRAV